MPAWEVALLHSCLRSPPLSHFPRSPGPGWRWGSSGCHMQVVKKKHRTRILEFFIDVARECFNIGNFNSMMAIICEYELGCPPPPSCTWPNSLTLTTHCLFL